jgi:DNA excision repair protein ERCC-2
MTVRFDSENRSLELSVGDLIDSSLARHLGFANRGGHERKWLGQAIHSRYQEQSLHQDPTYQREVSVSTELAHRGWKVAVQGRIDGLRKEEDGTVVVEEIKSIRRGSAPSNLLREVYAKQALLYAWMLAKAGEKKLRVELVWIEIGSEEIDHEPIEFNRAQLETAIRKRLNVLIRDFESGQAAVATRRSTATRISFPHEELRPGQEQIVEAVDECLEDRSHLFVEAPTGIGKTVAAILPTLKYALANDKRVFVLTAKTLQQEMAMRVLMVLNQEDAFHSLQLRAKSKMCANDQVLCHEEYCPFARDYYSKLQSSALMPKLLDDFSTLLPERIFDAAKEHEVCPFEVSLELSREGQVVVCDYNYAFEPYVSLSDFSEDSDLRDVILIIDEIHNLVDRGRGYYSPELTTRQFETAGEFMAKGRDDVHQHAVALCAGLQRLIEETVTRALEEEVGQVEAVETIMPEDDLWAFRARFDEVFIDYLEYRRDTSSFRADDPFVDLYFKYLRFMDGLSLGETDGEASSHCAQRAGGTSSLRILCKDPSRFLGRIINRTHSTIGLSATLSPTEFYRDLLGFDPERLASLCVPSPFPAENRSIVIDPSVATVWRKRPENYPRIAERLGAFAQQVPGNCLALFPSYQFLNEVAGRLETNGKRVLVQSAAGSDQERAEILQVLRSALMGDVLLLAVAGGVFAEGVDYPGDMLKAVAVVGPCLPAVSLEQELLKRYYDDRFERGFEYSFVIPGMTRVVQAAGRLIRSATDTGVIALFDERFLMAPYKNHLPADWMALERPSEIVGDPSRVAERFFRQTTAQLKTTEAMSE